VRIDFGASTSGAFAALVRTDGSGALFSVYSGAGPATAPVAVVPTMWARLSCVTTQTGVRSLTVLTVTR
jgi:hypothetical protein